VTEERKGAGFLSSYTFIVDDGEDFFSERQTEEIREAREGNIAVPIIKCHTDLCRYDETRVRNPSIRDRGSRDLLGRYSAIQ